MCIRDRIVCCANVLLSAQRQTKQLHLSLIHILDGFIMTNCILAASKLHPEVLSYAIFGHQGDETGHKLVLDAMKVRPLLNLGLRLGEGTGAICAYPIVVSSVNMMNEMDNFCLLYTSRCV